MTRVALIGIGVALVLLVGPSIVGLAGSATRNLTGATSEAGQRWNWQLVVTSALLYTLAFNLTFFIQELFLVLPKALTPGLRPTLFHNNHTWQGDHPLARLLQGTGALAIFLCGVTCALLLRRGSSRSFAVRLFLIWMTYNGLLQSLPQVIVGAVVPENDVGMAMDYLRFSATAKTVAAFVALGAIPLVAIWLTQPLLSLAEDPAYIATARGRARYMFQVATLPALIAILLIIPFRVPREWIEVILVPVVVTVIGIAWLQAGAWRARAVQASGRPGVGSIAYPLSAVAVLLLVFQLLLRPGVHFY